MSIVQQIKDLDFPSTLFKYRHYYKEHNVVSDAVKSLYNQEIYIPSADTFNDPYDSAIPFRYNPKDLTADNIFKKSYEMAKHQFPKWSEEALHNYAYENQKKGLLDNPDHIEQFDKETFRRTCVDFGIFCLTEDSVNNLMWSYYADSHKGFCVGYNTEKIIISQLFGLGGKVRYEDAFPVVPLFPGENHHHFLDLFYVKWNVWSHENEYRLLHTYKTGKVHKFDIDLIDEVILGCKFPDNEKLSFANKLLAIYPHLKIYEIKLNKERFELEKLLFIDGTAPLIGLA